MVGDQKDFVLLFVPTSTNFSGYTDGAELLVQSRVVSQDLLCCLKIHNRTRDYINWCSDPQTAFSALPTYFKTKDITSAPRYFQIHLPIRITNVAARANGAGQLHEKLDLEIRPEISGTEQHCTPSADFI